MSVELGLSPDQEAVEELFSTFFAKESPPSVARAVEPLGFDRALWDRLAETGAPGMGVEGATLGDLVVAAEQLGRAIAPVPLVEHLVASRAHPVPELCDGSSIATVSLRSAVEGTWRLVPAGAVADVVVGVDGEELVAVRSTPPGEGPRNHASAPLADRSTAGDRTVLGPASGFDAVLAEWQTLTAGALVGVAGAALDLGVEYAKARHQFGVPIGTFQAVQHALAELPGLIDGARLLTHKAAWASTAGTGTIDTGDNAVEDPLALASMAFVFAGDVAALATDRALHVHGGYGFSEEYDIQLYYRRARGWALVLDDPAAECRRLADRLFGAA